MKTLKRVNLTFITDGDFDLPELRRDIINMLDGHESGVWFEDSSIAELRGRDYFDTAEALSIDTGIDTAGDWADIQYDQRGDRS